MNEPLLTSSLKNYSLFSNSNNFPMNNEEGNEIPNTQGIQNYI